MQNSVHMRPSHASSRCTSSIARCSHKMVTPTYLKALSPRMAKEVTSISGTAFDATTLRQFVGSHTNASSIRSSLMRMNTAIEQITAEHYAKIVEEIVELVMSSSDDRLSAATIKPRAYTNTMHVRAMETVYNIMPQVYPNIRAFVKTHEAVLKGSGHDANLYSPEKVLLLLYEYVAGEVLTLAKCVVSDGAADRTACTARHREIAIECAKHLLGIDIQDGQRTLESVIFAALRKKLGGINNPKGVEDIEVILTRERNRILRDVREHQDWSFAVSDTAMRAKMPTSEPFYTRVERATQQGDIVIKPEDVIRPVMGLRGKNSILSGAVESSDA